MNAGVSITSSTPGMVRTTRTSAPLANMQGGMNTVILEAKGKFLSAATAGLTQPETSPGLLAVMQIETQSDAEISPYPRRRRACRGR